MAPATRHHMNPLSQILTRQPDRLSLVAGLLIALIVTGYWLLTRTPMTCEGLGDCVKYTAMSEAFRSASFGEIDSPFNTRVLAPWLSSLLPVTITQGFLITNAIASLVFVVAWHGIARALGLRNVEFAALLAWFFVHPLGFALYHAMPGSVDPLAHAMLGLTTWAYLRRHASLPALLMLGLLTKESFSFICLIIIAAELARMRLAPTNDPTRKDSLQILGYMQSAHC